MVMSTNRKIVKSLLIAAGVIAAVALAWGFIFYTPVPEPIRQVSFEKKDADLCEVYTEAGFTCSFKWVETGLQPVGVLSSFTKNGKNISLEYSKGDSIVVSPYVSGLTIDEAQKIIWKAGLMLGEEIEEKHTLDKGTVLRASLEPGERARNGESLNLHVSTGEVPLPKWIGKTRSFVENHAEQKGITVEFVMKESNKSPNTVIALEPKKGIITSDDIVHVTIARPYTTPEEKIPNVIGLNVDDAETLLSAYGFINIEVKGNGSIVKSVSPDVATKMRVTKKVTLTVHEKE